MSTANRKETNQDNPIHIVSLDFSKPHSKQEYIDNEILDEINEFDKSKEIKINIEKITPEFPETPNKITNRPSESSPKTGFIKKKKFEIEKPPLEYYLRNSLFVATIKPVTLNFYKKVIS